MERLQRSLDAGIVPVVLLDAPEPGDAISQIRFSHFVFYAPPVDIAADGAGVIVPDLAFAQTAGYLDLPEGESRIVKVDCDQGSADAGDDGAGEG